MCFRVRFRVSCLDLMVPICSGCPMLRVQGWDRNWVDVCTRFLKPVCNLFKYIASQTLIWCLFPASIVKLVDIIFLEVRKKTLEDEFWVQNVGSWVSRFIIKYGISSSHFGFHPMHSPSSSRCIRHSIDVHQKLRSLRREMGSKRRGEGDGDRRGEAARGE